MGAMEPWLRGTIHGLHPAAAHLLYTFEQAREEIEQFCSMLTVEEVWRNPHQGVASVGFQLRHMAGSIDRLTIYLRAEQLNPLQLAALRQEHEPGPSVEALVECLEVECRKTEAVVRTIAPSSYEDRRVVGRKQAPTTVGGLIVHISEHTQRHLGQAVLTAKLVRALPPLPSLAG